MSDDAARLHERVLVLRCQTGDDSAFMELVEQYHARLHSYLRTLLRSADRVDDALQEVWFDVFRSVPQLADPSAFSAWVYRIAHNRAMRELGPIHPLAPPFVPLAQPVEVTNPTQALSTQTAFWFGSVRACPATAKLPCAATLQVPKQ